MMKKRVVTAFILLVFALVCLPVATYAWFTYVYASSSVDFSTGKLAPETEIYLWDKETETWTEVAEIGGSYLIYPNLGQVSNLFELSQELGVYLKIRVKDTADAAYKWDVVVADIAIRALDSSGVEIPATEQNRIGLLDYYGGEGGESSQKCFYFKTALAADNLDPTGISSYGGTANLDQPEQSLTGNFVPSESFLYVHITAGTAEIQNIIRCIPIDKMPYVIQFVMTFTGQGRTID